MQLIINLFNHYGYIVLLIALILELIALPLPGEALMTYCGYVIYMRKMNWPLSIIIAGLGAATGITLSYFIGKLLGKSFFEKHGHYIHMDKKRLDKISVWFERYGNRLILIAYFIPGVRHVTGYFSGIIKIPYKKFVLNAYMGAFIWTGTFISLGKIFGADWEKYHSLMKKYLLIIGIILLIILTIIYIYRSHKQVIDKIILRALDNSIRIFHSLGRVKALIAIIAVLFIIFSALVIGIIQDYLAHEFSQFDFIVSYIVANIFSKDWTNTMRVFSNLSNIYVLLIVSTLTVIWIALNGMNKLYEISFLMMSFLGGELLSSVLRVIFHRLGPFGTNYTFPSSKILMLVVVYGFLIYMIIRYSKKTWINIIAISFYLCVCVISGISMIYFNLQYPSDVAAGFEFGFLWLCISIILLEVYRVLPKIKG